MAKVDTRRWEDWRATNGEPLRETRRCGCGAIFRPQVSRQHLCLKCIRAAVEVERARLREEEAESVVASVGEGAASDCARVVGRRIESVQALTKPEPRIPRPAKPGGKAIDVYNASVPGRARKGGRRSSAKSWIHIAQRMKNDGHSMRTIASRLGVSVKAVKEAMK